MFVGGGGIASSSLKKKLLLLESGTPINILNILYIFCTCTNSYIVYPEYFVCRGGGDWYSYIVYPYYTVYPMLSAWGNLFKCHEEVLFYFYLLYWCSYIVYPYYTVYLMLSAWGNLFKCHEEFLFYFFTCCIGIPI